MAFFSRNVDSAQKVTASQTTAAAADTSRARAADAAGRGSRSVGTARTTVRTTTAGIQQIPPATRRA
jgi:hypothetical protein